MPVAPKSGVLETTQTTGTGPYTLDGASTGARAWTSSDTGLQFHYCVRTATQFEVGLGTFTNTGRTLSRDTIIANHLNTTSPVSWGAGTKEVAIVLPAERTAMRDVENTWLAAQRFNGQTLWLDADADTGFQIISDDELRYLAGNVEFMRWDFANKEIKLVADDSGATLKPGLSLHRDTASPANSDRLGYIRYSSRDSAQALVTYAFTSAFIESPTAGASAGRYLVEVLYAGAMKPIMSFRGLAVSLEPNVNLVTGAKLNSDPANVGAEMLANGQMIAVALDTHPLQLNRRGSDGTVAEFRRENSVKGAISISSETTTYGTFTGVHFADWAPGLHEPHLHEAEGTVVSTEEGLLPGRSYLPLVRPASSAGDPRVYGVIVGRYATPIDEETRPLLHIAGLGTWRVRCIGRVRAGDLLEPSDVPGVARVQEGRVITASTLGKATQNGPTHGREALIPAVLYAG